MNEKAQALEALLFVAGEPIDKAELARVLECSADEINQYLAEISEQLSGHGLSIVETEHEVSLTTSVDVAAYLQNFLPDSSKDLSKAAAETLSIVAYRGPIALYEIDMLRGVDSRRMVRQLLYRGAIRRVESPGRAQLYDITSDFLQQLGITSREELPRYEELSTHENVVQLLNQDSSKSS